ncbi:hypothetical protein Tco_1454977, partial [Tanacetum coccineum]
MPVANEVPNSSINECRAIFANKGIQVDGTNELHGVSIIVDDVQDAKEEDDVPSK